MSLSFIEKWKAQRAAQQRQDRLAQRRAERKSEAKARAHTENLRRQIAELAQAQRTEENERRAQGQNLLEQLQVQRKQERRRSEQSAEALAEVRQRINATRRQERQKEDALPNERAVRRPGIQETARQTKGIDRSAASPARNREGGNPVRRLVTTEKIGAVRQSNVSGAESIAERRKARRLEEQFQLRLLRQRETLRKKHLDEQRDERPLAAPELERSRPDPKRQRESLLARVQTAFRQAMRNERRSRERQQLRTETRASEIKTTRREQMQREIRRTERLQEQRTQREQNATVQQRLEATRKQEVQRRIQEQRILRSEEPRRGEGMRVSRPARQLAPFVGRSSEGLSWLGTAAQRIVDQRGRTVHLRGVNVAGLDAVCSAGTMRSELALDAENLSILTGLWGINIVRLPFQASTILRGNESLRADQFLTGLDDLVGSISESGAFTLLAMRAPGRGSVSELPGGDAFTCWQLLAARYQQEPGVLFEVYSAPSSLPEGWLDAAHLLIGTIRREHPASLCFVGGSGGGTTLEDLPLRFATGETVHNVVNTVRFTARRALTEFDPGFLAFVRTHPVAVTEWIHNGLDLGQASELGARLFSRYGLSWVACHWNAEPRLVDDAAKHRFGETRFGMIARRALAVPLQP